MRMGRGDVRAAVLALLAEKPMHGYQIIHEIEERSGGSVEAKPRLGVPDASATRGRGTHRRQGVQRPKDVLAHRRGEAKAAAAADRPRRGRHRGLETVGARFALPKAGIELAQAPRRWVVRAARSRSKQAVAVLDDARRKLYAILAQD